MPRLQDFTKSILVHGNAFADTASISSTTNVTNAANAFDGVTTTKAEITATGAIIEFTFSSAVTASAICLAVHNGTTFSNCQIDLERFTTSWVNVDSFNIASVSSPIVREFTEVSDTQWRLVFTLVGGSGSLFVGDITLGTATALPSGMSTGFTSPKYANDDDINYNRTLGGQLAGLNVSKNGTNISIPVKYMTEKWTRNYAAQIIQDLRNYPFYFRWDDVDFLNNSDTFFGWLRNKQPKPTWQSRQFLEMTIDANGITDNG